MSHPPRLKPAPADSVPVRVASLGRSEGRPSDPPAPLCPEAVSERPQPAGTDRQGDNKGRPLPACLEPMLSLEDLAAVLNCSRRLVERLRSAGRLPRPDLRIGKMPRWKVQTIREWIDRVGRPC